MTFIPSISLLLDLAGSTDTAQSFSNPTALVTFVKSLSARAQKAAQF